MRATLAPPRVLQLWLFPPARPRPEVFSWLHLNFPSEDEFHFAGKAKRRENFAAACRVGRGRYASFPLHACPASPGIPGSFAVDAVGTTPTAMQRRQRHTMPGTSWFDSRPGRW